MVYQLTKPSWLQPKNLMSILSWKEFNVLLSDGHGFRPNHDVLSFSLYKQIQLFVTSPDTTDVTQLLDQLVKNIH